MSLSVFAFALVVSALPRWYAYVALGSVACAFAGFGAAFVVPEAAAMAVVVGLLGVASATLVVAEGVAVALSFVPEEFYWTAS